MNVAARAGDFDNPVVWGILGAGVLVLLIVLISKLFGGGDQ